MLAAQLYQRGVAVSVIENALVLAAARRMMRPADAPPLGTIRSLAYFLPVIEEVLAMRVRPDYFQYLRHKQKSTRLNSSHRTISYAVFCLKKKTKNTQLP